MILNRKTLRKLILKEIFEKGAAAYQFVHKVDGRLRGRPHSHEYMFKTDHDLTYVVHIYAMSEYGSWDVVFNTVDPLDPLDDSVELTGKNDIKVLNTIIQVVKDFVANVRPTLPHPLYKFTNFKCEAAQEETHSGTDDRRGRIYQYMLKKQGIASDLSVDNSGRVIIEFEI